MAYGKYSKKFEIHYYEVDKYKEASPVAILNYLEETAISHSQAVGLGIDHLSRDGIGWILNKWTIKMERYPLYGDMITVETWPSGFKRFYADREFVIKDEKGEIMGRASSVWILINIERRRPTRIPEHFGELYGIDAKKALVVVPPDEEPSHKESFEKEFDIMRSDIDTNSHVNNTKYVGWLLETLPEEVYNNSMLSFLDIEYKKEVESGSVICRSYGAISNESLYSTYIHQIHDKSANTTAATARTQWIRR